jgi:hypothetical protein
VQRTENGRRGIHHRGGSDTGRDDGDCATELPPTREHDAAVREDSREEYAATKCAHEYASEWHGEVDLGDWRGHQLAKSDWRIQ